MLGDGYMARGMKHEEPEKLAVDKTHRSAEASNADNA